MKTVDKFLRRGVARGLLEVIVNEAKIGNYKEFEFRDRQYGSVYPSSTFIY